MGLGGDWAAVLGSGLLLGWIISLMELIEQPMAGTSPSVMWDFLSAKGGYWMGVGVVWAIFVQLAEPRFGAVALMMLGLLASVAHERGPTDPHRDEPRSPGSARAGPAIP